MSQVQFFRQLARLAILCVVAAFVLGPLVATVLGGFKSNTEIRINAIGLPETWQLEHYANIASSPEFWRYLVNSKVSIGNRDVTRDEPSERGISMVFQSYALYPHMTVAQNIDFGLRLAKVPVAEREQRVSEAARILHLEELLDRKPAALSGGQRQRVAIGRSIVRQPKVFLFDEPLSNLDAALRTQMRVELAQLNEQFTATMVYVTHDQVEAMTLADQIVVMNAGRIEQIGPPMELYEKPRSEFVATFIGSPKMNLLPGKAIGREDIGSVGIRPEHIKLDESSGDWPAEVLVVENLGSDTVAYVQADELGPMTVRISGHRHLATHSRVFLPPRS